MAPLATQGSYVLVLGTGRDTTVELARSSAEMAGQDVSVEARIDDVAAELEQEGCCPTAIVIDMADEGALEHSIQVRSRFALAAVPVIGLCPEITDLAFEEAFSVGMDDCCPPDTDALGRLLRAIEVAPRSQVARRGQGVVVADTDRSARLLAGRVFHTAGYDVAFALNASDALRRAREGHMRVVVCSTGILDEVPAGEPLWRHALRAGSEAVWVLNTPPKQMQDVLRLIAPEEQSMVDVHDAFSAPANLLFVANELLGRPVREARKSARVLYGTCVSFRPAGAHRAAERVGYSYNISGGGFYVRSLAPPQRDDELWLEFQPPRCDRRVHLEGTVRWARRYGPGPGATVPAGFGLEITGATPADQERYQNGYEAFLAERTSFRETARPPRS